MGGMRISDTREVTIFPKAVPIMTPTARSMTFPLMANDLNSAINDAIGQAFRRKRLLLDLGKRANGAGAEFHADTANLFGLEVYFERTPGGDIRVTSGVSGGGSATGEGAYSAHN